MKKLMIAAAIVCAAIAGNATSFMWGNGSGSINNAAGTADIDPDLSAPMYKDGMMFLYLGTIGYEDGTGFTGLDTAKLITSGGYDSNQYAYGNFDTSAWSTGDVNKMGGEAFSLILVDNSAYTSLADLKDGDGFVLRTDVSASDYDGDLSDNYAIFADYNAIAASDWQTYSSVPEPTSGLLLLLGVAGLALRRRRA